MIGNNRLRDIWKVARNDKCHGPSFVMNLVEKILYFYSKSRVIELFQSFRSDPETLSVLFHSSS